MTELPTIGFVGLGNMGGPMVGRLAKAGNALRVYDLSEDALAVASRLDGVVAAPSPAGVAEGAAVVVLMLPGSDVVEAVVDQGLLDAMQPGSILVDMSSSVPQRTRALATRAATRDVVVVDAPVSGGVRGAVEGTLTIMVGGSEEAVASLTPVLETLGSTIRHAGATGAGHAVKALNNLMSATHLLSSSEAMVAGIEFGLDPEVVLDIVNGSSGRSGSTQNKWPNFVLPGTFDSGFGLRLMLKDMTIALDLLEDTATPAALSRQAVQLWSEAAKELPADADHTEVAHWVRDRVSRPSA
ncbi:MAG: NAD(P)-dependent oxidoreductase [Acidimicrobiales bacterium]